MRWQGAINKSIQTKGREARLAGGWEGKPRFFTFGPHRRKDLKFTVEEGETGGGRGLEELPGVTNVVIFEASFHLGSHCLVVLKIYLK